MADNELVEWTIALISNQENVEKGLCFTVADLVVGLTERQRLNGNDQSDLKYRIRRLVSPSDEWIDLSEEEFAQAKEETQRIWNENAGKIRSKELPELPSGLSVRRIRPSKRGLLLLYMLKHNPEPDSLTPATSDLSGVPIVGIAISFPESNRGDESAIEYVVNNIYWQQEFGGEA
jgi:hypothetical protein